MALFGNKKTQKDKIEKSLSTQDENFEELDSNYKNTSNLEAILSKIDDIKSNFEKQLSKQEEENKRNEILRKKGFFDQTTNNNSASILINKDFIFNKKVLADLKAIVPSFNDPKITNKDILDWLNKEFDDAKYFEYSQRKAINFDQIVKSYKIWICDCNYFLIINENNMSKHFLIWTKNNKIIKIKAISKWSKILFKNSFFSILFKTLFTTIIVLMMQLFLVNDYVNFIIFHNFGIPRIRSVLFYICLFSFFLTFFIFFCIPLWICNSKNKIKLICFSNIVYVLAIGGTIIYGNIINWDYNIFEIVFLAILFCYVVVDIAFIAKCWVTKR